VVFPGLIASTEVLQFMCQKLLHTAEFIFSTLHCKLMYVLIFSPSVTFLYFSK